MAKKATRKRTRTARPASGKRTATRGRAAPAARAARRSARRKPTTVESAAVTLKGTVKGAIVAIARRLPGASDTTDAIELLEADHRTLEDLLKRGEETTQAAVKLRRDLLRTITADLDVHEKLEEKILYPALEGHPEARDIVLEGFQEHHVADVLVRELHHVAADDEQWRAKFKVLKENLEHHIEEEEGEMFRTARGLFSQEQLRQMGAKMQRMKALARRSTRR